MSAEDLDATVKTTQKRLLELEQEMDRVRLARNEALYKLRWEEEKSVRSMSMDYGLSRSLIAQITG